ncbi:MAG: hypothetical protein HQM04_06170 [Magnetococcales bacterium]|nr:hypothetical protein [Magnetococcales bacterium]MBF0114612.1 hypothetical protein [Magnetococcales bacterium]
MPSATIDSPTIPFLQQCDPRAKLLTLLLLAPLLYRYPMLSWGWLGSLFMLFFILNSNVKQEVPALFRQWWRLRWLIVTLLLLHGLLTPGEPIWSWLPWLSWQGVREGGQQLLRLLLLIAFAWLLVRSTTPLQWVIGLYRLFGFFQRFGVPVQQGCALLAFALGSMPALMQEARHIQEEGRLRYSGGTERMTQRLQRVAEQGQALLLRLLQRAYAQEESLHLRGFAHGLPFVILHHPRWHWRDTLLLGWPVFLWIVQGVSPG